MDTIYFDWGRGKVTTLLNDSDRIVYYRSVDELLNSLTEPHNIVSEATFESYEPTTRAKVIERGRAAGHNWLTTPNRQTGRHRLAMGIEKKTDEIDVTVIRHLAQTQPRCLKAPNVRGDSDPVVIALRAANTELRDLRRTYRMVEAPRTALGFKTIGAKDEYAEYLASTLPEYSTLPPYLQAALGNGDKYSLVLLAAAGKAAKFSNSRSEFEQLTGLYAHGYPSQIRSDFHHWRWRFARPGAKGKLAGQITLSEFRKGCRWLYHRLDERRDVL